MEPRGIFTDEHGDRRTAYITVDKPVLKSSYTWLSDGTPIVHKPKNNNQFVVFTITIKATDAGFTYNELQFYMRGPSGDNITTSLNEGTLTHNPKISYGTLQKDETASGLLDYDAPEHGTLVFDYNSFVPIDEAIGEWRY